MKVYYKVRKKKDKTANIVWKKRLSGNTKYEKVICKHCGKENTIQINDITVVKVPYCSSCNRRLDTHYKNYCPNCGKKLTNKL